MQHPDPARAACLVTVHGPEEPLMRTSEIALSLPLRSSYHEILSEAAAALCADDSVACSLHVGHLELAQDQPVLIHDGLGLVVRVLDNRIVEEADETLLMSFSQSDDLLKTLFATHS